MEDENALFINAKLYIDTKIIKLIDVEDAIDGNVFKENYKNIRRRHYGWMTKVDYCKKLIRKGVLDEKEYQSKLFKLKDCGECSLIAIALTAPNDYIIISEDKGKVYKHPDVNIFDIYKDKDILIVTYDKWKYKDKIDLYA